MLTAIKSRNNRDYLIMPQIMFQFKLIVANTCIGFSNMHNTVQNILSTCPLIQWKVKLTQFIRDWRENNTINTLSDHRKHTCPFRIKLHILS